MNSRGERHFSPECGWFSNPAIRATGVLYLTINVTGFDLATVAWLHVVVTYAMAILVVIHVYMATTGETVTAYLKAMITGYEWGQRRGNPRPRRQMTTARRSRSGAPRGWACMRAGGRAMPSPRFRTASRAGTATPRRRRPIATARGTA